MRYKGKHYCDDKSKFYQKSLFNLRKCRLHEIETDGAIIDDNIVDIGSTPVSKKTKYVISQNSSKKMKHAKVNSKKLGNKKNKKKGFIISVVALVMGGIMAISAAFYLATRPSKKNNGSSGSSNSTFQTFDDLDTVDLNSLGEELPTENKKTEHTKVSGNFNIEDVVRGADGVLYDSQESAKNASKSGTTVIDTHNGEYVVGSDGDVYTREGGYEVVDKDGKTVDSGNGTPSDVSGENDIEYVICPCNYYDDIGTLVHSAGDYITPEELELCKQYYHTTKPKNDEYVKVEEEITYFDETATTGLNNTQDPQAQDIVESSVQETPTSTEETYETTTFTASSGSTNADGTYTVNGQTYSSYADYQQYIFDDGAGYGEFEGVIQPIGDYEIETQYTL